MLENHDLIIIGGGIAGRFCAWHAARHHLDVLLLDPDDARLSAAWASGGMLAPVAEGLTGGLLDIGLAARARWPATVEHLRDATGHPLKLQHGIVVPLAPEAPRAPMAGYLQQMRRHADISIIDAGTPLPAACRFERAALIRDEFVVDPRAVLAALSTAIDDRVQVTRAKATRIDIDADTTTVTTEHGIHRSRATLICAGHRAAVIEGLAPLLPGHVTGERGVLLYVRSNNRPPWTIFDHGLDGVTYLVPTQHGYRIGATADPEDRCRTARPQEIELLLDRASRLWYDPGAEVAEAVAGARPTGPLTTGEPFVGALDPQRRVWGLLGMHRNGILFSPLLSETIIERIMQCLSN